MTAGEHLEPSTSVGETAKGRPLSVLAIEPFCGGSHRAFLDGWSRRSRHEFDLVTFADRHWKWRMRHGALSSAEEVRRRLQAGRKWDVVWASDMLDLATFRGLCPEVGGLPTVFYFHENQLTYPWRSDHAQFDGGAGRDGHYAYTNFLSALAADRVWFNSGFHRDEWLRALPPFLERFPDHHHVESVELLEDRSEVHYPGVDGADQSSDVAPGRSAGFHVVWAARWEHDKNPEGFFDALRAWRRSVPEHWEEQPDREGSGTSNCASKSRSLPVHLHILGQAYGRRPSCFDEAKREFSPFIATWGFVERDAYRRCLAEADVFVSTARHEFFGISAVEAMVAGAHPVLPRRLSYPELVGGDVDALVANPSSGQEADAFAERLGDLYEAKVAGDLPRRDRWRRLGERYGWDHRVGDLDCAVERAVDRLSAVP